MSFLRKLFSRDPDAAEWDRIAEEHFRCVVRIEAGARCPHVLSTYERGMTGWYVRTRCPGKLYRLRNHHLLVCSFCGTLFDPKAQKDGHARETASVKLGEVEAAEKALAELRELLREAVGTHGEPCGPGCTFKTRALALLRAEDEGGRHA